MKSTALLSGVLVLALVGCGLVPPINVGDALQLGGKSTTVTLGPSAQSTGTIGGSGATFTFADNASIDVPLTPSNFTYSMAISGVSFGAGCTVPATTTVQIQNLKVVLSDPAFTTAAQQPSATASNLSFTVTKSGSTLSVSGVTGNDLSFSNLGNVSAILKQGGTNTLTLSGTVSTSPDVGSCTMTINWGAGTGTIKL